MFLRMYRDPLGDAVRLDAVYSSLLSLLGRTFFPLEVAFSLRRHLSTRDIILYLRVSPGKKEKKMPPDRCFTHLWDRKTQEV